MKALLVHPEFSHHGFWNYQEVCRLAGAKYPAAPLGLITLAALLPQDWQIRLIDMNSAPLGDDDIAWADLVFAGGMLPQQVALLKLVERVHDLGRKMVVGGPDPTSQPTVYASADYLVLGEGECTVPLFLRDLEAHVDSGIYEPDELRPDVTQSPVPRFDLLRFEDYLMIGIQVTRGCPFNCEFCDIIELYGRVPRAKTPHQIIEELETLYSLGYRGHIDFVDDNFIGNKKRLKETLNAIKGWSIAHRYPFFFSTEASINLADDEELLELMRDIDFRYVFVGIEAVDDLTLRASNKNQNLNREIVGDLEKLYSYGMIVNGGFIVGFDSETSGSARSIADLVRDGRICMAMVGLLNALPNTRLTRRLHEEGRLIEDSNLLGEDDSSCADQTTMGLNFVTLRARAEIVDDYLYVIREIYGARAYFARCLHLARSLRPNQLHRPSVVEAFKMLVAFGRVVLRLGILPPVALYFWRNIMVVLVSRPANIEPLVNVMSMYIHFRRQSAHIVDAVQRVSEAKLPMRFRLAEGAAGPHGWS
ncbi:MAG TPA: B12-binding domain-containing radical SAM protein [Spirochaetia bacterium]|nr:B12-binding domain-containing radical SAM protein [Spirochaetia bacterium]